jgi:hypothetical protein
MHSTTTEITTSSTTSTQENVLRDEGEQDFFLFPVQQIL